MLPDETIVRYVKRLIKNIKAMYPYARIHGIRYYFDTDYRRHHSRRRHDLARKARGGLQSKSARKRAKDDLIERDGQLCNFCKQSFERDDLTIDHIYPLFMGGDSELYNLQLLCRPCHGDKCRLDTLQYCSA